MIQPNGTDAKEIALYFVNLVGIRTTPKIMAKTINQAKVLLSNGYSMDEIITAMDYVHLTLKVEMYSLGYMNACINDVLRDIQKLHEKEQQERAKEEVKKALASQDQRVSEVKTSDESKERNQDKARRLGVQSRFREKFNFDMFEGK